MYDKTYFTYDEIMRRINHPDRFVGKNNMRITEIQNGFARGEMENIPATQNSRGGIHGGALSALADTAAGVAVSSLGKLSVTVHNTMEYLRPACPGPVTCEARVRKDGKNIVVVETAITDTEGREVAIGTFSFQIMGTIPLE